MTSSGIIRVTFFVRLEPNVKLGAHSIKMRKEFMRTVTKICVKELMFASISNYIMALKVIGLNQYLV